MIKLSFDEAVSRIVEKTSTPKDEVIARIDKKMKQLYGLISKEGAAHIIANELGIKLIDEDYKNRQLQINNILTGMTNVEVAGRVVQVYDAREFNSNGRQGKVGSLIIGDDSGTIRVVLWNEFADNLSSIKQGDIIKFNNAYVRERNENKEIHLSNRSNLEINPAGVEIKAQQYAQSASRKKLADVSEKDDSIETVGTIVQVYNPRFYEICPTCSKRARPNDGSFMCNSHGQVQPGYAYVMNVFIDDGTENMRVACFNEQVREVLKKQDEEIQLYRNTPETFEDVKNDLLGTFIKVAGRVKKNEMTGRYELTARSVSMADPDEELELAKKEAK